nr:hypothetical protein [uncultured Pseudomonas sp.]
MAQRVTHQAIDRAAPMAGYAASLMVRCWTIAYAANPPYNCIRPDKTVCNK